MSEYRRFIAYFYEYIDGKKRKNAGFAKVELRNGMWRILFRLTIPMPPEPPMRVCGFVQEGKKLLSFPLGTMDVGCRGPEEWAWRADAPVGLDKYYFHQMAGIQIQSGDGRTFITVWDDEVPPSVMPEPERKPLEMPKPEIPEPERKIPEMPEPETPELERKPQEIPERKIPGSDQEISEMPEKETQEMTELAQKSSEGIKVLSDCEKRSMKQNCAENLLRGRQRFQPFQDEEFTDCVQIKLCDILPLQQENWQVGRSNFLQHGYYLYRHLLLGRAKNGGYILGVPGVRSQQEEYMAYTFGYDQFKLSALRGCGQRYGYWYRILKEPEYSSVSTESKL